MEISQEHAKVPTMASESPLNKLMTDEKQNHFPCLELLGQVFQSYPNIDAVYLFGSAAKGCSNINSDLDLAVATRDPSLSQKKVDILADLARLGFCNVDLVFLDVEDIVLRFEAVKHNKIVYKKEGFDTSDFFSKTLRMYSDFLPYLRVQREAFKRRLSGDKPRNHSQETP